MSRTVLAVMAGLLCAMAGIKHGAALKSDALRLLRWGQLLRHLALLMQEGSLPIPEALLTAADSMHPPDKLLHAMVMRMRSSPLTSLAEAFRACHSEWAENDVLLRMFASLGQGSKANRLLALEQAAGEIRLLSEAASARAEKDVKLWQTLGLAGGVCLTILLL